jgi:type II secretion system protein N
MKKVIIGALAAVWGLAIFVVALHVHFPGDAALERAQWEVQDGSDGGWAIDAGAANLWMLSGVEIEDLIVYKVDATTSGRRGAEDEDPAEAVPFLRAENARARLSLLPLLMGEREVAFDADVYGGNVSGTVAEGTVTRRVVLEGEDLDLSRIPLEGEDWNIEATGKARLDADLTLDAEDVKASEGTLKLVIDEFAIESAKAMGLDLTPASFTEAVLEIALEGGKANIESGSFISDIIGVELDGHITMSKRPWDRWRMKVGMKLQLGDELDTMAKFLPTLKNARGDDERYHFTCSGSLGRPRCREDKTVAGVTGGRSAAKTGGSRDKDRSKRRKNRAGRRSKKGVDDADDGEDRSEARERRLERIRERRERLRERREARAAERGDEDPEVDDLQRPLLGGPVGIADPAGRFDDAQRYDEVDDPDGDGRPGFDPPNEFRPPNDFGIPDDFEENVDGEFEDPNY